ncbi:hypothetical protein AB0G15_15840 [Streptosporangium sp. NPDC023825]|uniref:hypothetical protein n=1 Tax=Streptosporangium sp. NPDC023825 TaxID=3154909 RepID=UPI00342D81B6
MRRIIATLTGATMAALIVPTLVTVTPAGAKTTLTAQAAATDPVSALKRQFRTHRGVKLTENTKVIGEGKKNRTIFTRRNGVLEFGRTGMVASDLTTKFNLPLPDSELKGLFAPSRTISLKGVSYTSGGIFAESMPEGKKWLRTPSGKVSLVSAVQQIISTVEPGTLRATLAHTRAKRPGGTWDGTRTTVHSGTITLAELFRVSPAVRTMLGKKPTGRSATLPVTWKIYLGSDQLVRRIVSSYTESTRGLNSTELTYVNDTRYTGWGTKVTIKAPPAGQVVEFDELLGDVNQPEDPIQELFQG